MNKSLIIAVLASSMLATLASCSLFQRSSVATEESGDVVPLYTVTTSSETSLSLDGHWYIMTVGTIQLRNIEDDDWPYLDFVADEARFYGNDGCNIINGSYHIDNNAITLSEVLTTSRLCQSDTLAYPIAQALNNTVSFAVSEQTGNGTVLTLKNSKDKMVMTLQKSDLEFLNGAWQVEAVNGKEVDMPDAKLVFDINSMQISGCVGCNRVNGVIARNPQVGSSIQLSGLVTTRMTCPDIQLESALLIALEEVAIVHRTAKRDIIELLNDNGKSMVTLRKLSRQDF